MPIDKVNNIISLQTYKKTKSTPEDNQEKPTIPIFKKSEIKGELIPLELISAHNGNIIVNSKIKEVQEFLKESHMNASDKEIKRALENYYNDFSELKKVIYKGESFYNDFIKTIQEVDFEGLEKIESIFGFGITSPLEKEFCDIQGIDPAEIVTNESFSIISDFIKTYALILSEKTDYDVIVFEDNNECSQIQIKKGDSSILLNPMIFYNIALYKKSFGDNKIVIQQEDGSTYLYGTKEEIAYKTDKKGHTIGALSKKDIDKNGNPKHMLDQELASGITYYTMAELYKMEDFDESEIIQDDILEDFDIPSEETLYNTGLSTMLDMIRNDSVAQGYFENGISPEFLYSCIRDGKFSEEVFQAKDRLYEIVEEALDGKDFDEEMLDQTFYLIEKEDNTFDNNAIDTIANLYIKNFSSSENFEPLIYEIATFIKDNPTDKNANSLIAMAQSQKIDLKDLKELYEILKLFNIDDTLGAISRLGEFASNKKENFDNDFNKAYRTYSRYFEGYLNN